MQVLQQCVQCENVLVRLDCEAQQYEKISEFYMVRQIRSNESWESCNPYNDFETYCETCFAPRLLECKKRIVGTRY